MTAKTAEQQIGSVEQKFHELLTWRDLKSLPLTHARFKSQTSDWQDWDPTTPWPSRDFPVQMEFLAQVPQEWAGHDVHLKTHVGGEALLKVNDEIVGGLNPYHKEYPILKHAQGGENLHIHITASPKGLFGSPIFNNTIEEIRLLVPDVQVRSFLEDVQGCLDAAKYQLKAGKHELAGMLADLMLQALSGLDLPRTPSRDYLGQLMKHPQASGFVAGLWDEWAFEKADLLLSRKTRETLQLRQNELQAALQDLKKRFPSEGRVLTSGHAHIDLAWLWPFHETRRKVERTFGTVLHLMDRYPEFTFNQSSAQAYQWIEQDNPTLFAKIQERVKEGRWEIIGGMWVEPDGNLLSGESWARQLLYGQQYFKSRFGKQVQVCWMPDTFGYAANLPQLLQLAEVPYFFTSKLNWNETNTFPYDLYHWEGIDGTQVIAHTFCNPNQGYNGSIEAFDIAETWKSFRGKRAFDTTLLSFGHGDGGGGPTEEMLERYDRLKDFPGLPKIEMGRVHDLYQRFEKESGPLPVWVGEQYLELHRGTYTTQAHTKKLHRELETLLPEAEAACALAHQLLGSAYPTAQLHDLWTTFLLHHFHDVLPGSSVHEVYQDTLQNLSRVKTEAETLRHTALQALSQQVQLVGFEQKLVFWNFSLQERPLQATVPCLQDDPIRLIAPDGQEVPHQREHDTLILDANLHIPPMGYLALGVQPETQQEQVVNLIATSSLLENAHLRVEIGEDGTVHALIDKTSGRNVLKERANQIWAYPDLPRHWEAWDVDPNYATDGQEIKALKAPVLVQSGPLQATIEVEREHNGTRLIQRYVLGLNAKRLDIENHLICHGRRTLWRAQFPLNVRSHEAWYETAYGALARPTHRNTSWQQAQFEVPAHRWADLSEAHAGVSLLNNGKYGHSAHGNTLGLTLHRSPLYPDPMADEGEYHFTYSLYPHAGDWRNGTVQEAQRLNSPLCGIWTSETGDWEPSRSLVQVSGQGVQFSSLKKAEEGNGLILRVYEALGGSSTVQVNAEGLQVAGEVNLLEHPLEGSAEIRPFQVKSILLTSEK
ncbi:alpha-mannosidase [Deinococcus misasensis]|uniref:alpha-mannosidase n=1 Tax=Deinococcus misasensis TaxID=392413 RepID=UPI000558C202|nr:glycoside hydrolase family 38 C-terminal domain-containing protein [Deinococcus misasensis]